ncbi:12566_t:CDS:2 [Ambispora gerdemannii]|uniref:12566_t:CDS:1 n=1 Tax=Ambispora gerdemannii TaxID=144530 RepID=A0A9N9CDC8_9GLOM|nr:12566_t:CDS:2 [Ambispora gerdemannii]
MINTPAMVLQNPKVVSTKGRPSGITNRQETNSTRRDPSGFELRGTLVLLNH